MDNETVVGYDEYSIKNWLQRLGSRPVAKLAYEDFSESYENNAAHVAKLENGQYALIVEQGCSCYDPSTDAQIELFQTEERAMEQFNKWVSENKR